MDHLTLKALKPTEYADAADGYRAMNGMADAAKDRIDNQITAAMRKANEGEAADAALKQLRKLSENFHYTQVECGLITGALDGFSSEIAAPKRRLTEALDDAVALAYTVNENGAITYPASGTNELTGEPIPGGTVLGNNGLVTSNNSGFQSPRLAPNDPRFKSPNPHYAKAVDIADRIAHAVREAQEIDDRYSKALRKLKAAPGLNVNTEVWADVASDVDAVSSAASDYIADHVPLDKSPTDRKEWWDNLSDEERAEYKAAFPEIIGNLDGIPAVVRDEANRGNIQLLIAELEARHDEAFKDKLDGLKGIRTKLDSGSQPPMFLLGVGLEGNGRAIVAFGNPDTSKNVSAYVPGLGTKLNSGFADGTVKRAFDTAKGAQGIDPSSSAIVWLGYDAPQSIDVMTTDDAERGAPAYNSFMSGISATNEHADPHITAIGHSYGSRLVGAATQEAGGIPGADDIILVGSPGVGVDKAADLGVGKDHVWVGAAENDIVTRLPSSKEAAAGTMGFFGGGPFGAYLGGEIADRGDDDIWFGKDPASKAFGANRFETLPGPELVHPSFPDVLDSKLDIDAHSNYFSPEDGKDKVSARNIAAITAGQPGYVTRETPR
ncbi:alpha/beta hydrolase family protein [Streptomyces sp. NBC_01571]|uniref:alpha/beta hydrolase n=1 Tax=Streptomyces sp. NBC_01571 TaxID=2975883 RepID=UPI002252C750|nr:alpha/beta hydrolase [Streptomyces sp. NBC_01571]MCX4576595.1 alpha/beta hydrolase family protein [Streptomyces sp. NBC_01571]